MSNPSHADPHLTPTALAESFVRHTEATAGVLAAIDHFSEATAGVVRAIDTFKASTTALSAALSQHFAALAQLGTAFEDDLRRRARTHGREH